MITKKHISILKQNNNYQIIRITDDYVEFCSRNTGHYWIIKKEPFEIQYPYTIYHKHKLTDYYHRHRQNYSFEKCLISILEHDNYVLRVDKLKNNYKEKKKSLM